MNSPSSEQPSGDVRLALDAMRLASEDVGLKLKCSDETLLQSVLGERLASGEKSLLPPVYKGVSFNPSTFNKNSGKQEWVLLLDFLSLLRAMQNRFGVMLPKSRGFGLPKTAVLDASFYWIVNLIGGDSVRLSGSSDRAAAALVELLLDDSLAEKYAGVVGVARVPPLDSKPISV